MKHDIRLFHLFASLIMVMVLAACAPAAPAAAPAAPAAESPADASRAVLASPLATEVAAAAAPRATEASKPTESPKAEAAKPIDVPAPAAGAAVTPTRAVAIEPTAQATGAPKVAAPTSIPATSTVLPPTPTALPPTSTTLPPTPTAIPATPTSTALPPTPTTLPAISTAIPAIPTTIPTPILATLAAPITETAAADAQQALVPSATLTAESTGTMMQVDTRIVELEWPPEMRLGGSESVRLALIPATDNYIVKVEGADHEVVTQTIETKPRPGFDLFAVAKLNAPKFDVSSDFSAQQAVIPNETLRWRWLISPREGGTQMASVLLHLRWEPQAGNLAKLVDGAALVDKPMQINVTSMLGMSTTQAASMGGMGLIASLLLGTFALAFRRAPALKLALAQISHPNAQLKIEQNPAITFAPDETALLQTLFRKYGRLVVQSEFRSGYSGARTLLALPVREDGRNDAYTIAKIGDRQAIQQEFDNYERYVKDTLPPVTARIQELPVTVSAAANPQDKAVLRYTFIGEPGKMPTSLRESLLREADPALLTKLFDTFGPNWWMQRKPHTFRLAAEYDAILPAHYVIEPMDGPAPRGAVGLDGRMPPGQERISVGDIVYLKNFPGVERRVDGQSLSLTGEGFGGNPPLRVRWMGQSITGASTGRVTATRLTLLRELAGNADLHGLPDPLPQLPAILNENVIGSRSTIHGDLNLENILVGPGGFVWLIDFAQTREGHPLADFAHLEAEIIAHVLAPHVTPEAFMTLLREQSHPLLNRLHEIAHSCLLNPSNAREYQLALSVTCLGAMKYTNLQARQRHLLYLSAAFWMQQLSKG